MSSAEEEDEIGGTCEWNEKVEILLGSEVASRENGIGSFVQRGGCSRTRMDMNNSYLPPLSDDIALIVLARIPRSKYCDLCLVNRRFRSLIRSGELNKIRKKIGFKEPKVFFVSNEAQYCCYEPNTRSCRNLPVCPYDKTTIFLDEESFCMGTHLFVTRNMRDSDIWRYELELNRWFYGPTMITPRYFFASADCGSVACIAGGTSSVSLEVLNSAEKYNPESKSWEPLLSNMNRRRDFCSGFYMDSKFYVIGGRDENRELLTCGECYDFERNVWELIPNMLEDDTPPTRNPYEFTDFMVVVNNELYYLESSSHHLKVYLKNENTWRKVGSAPVGLYSEVALKSLGNELFVVDEMYNQKTILCFCTPSPELDDVEWQVLDFNRHGPNMSIYNCCVMMV